MRRRELLKAAGFSALASAARPLEALALESPAAGAPRFSTTNAAWQRAYDRALEVLAGNVQVLPRFPAPVLIEGAEYAGIWQECGPHESLVYSLFRSDVARNTHRTFFALQREDGQLPANNKRSEVGFGQIQMVVPIAATAWELAQRTGDAELLEAAYRACSRWDAWLMRYRNTRGTGLVEGFCTYDTGMDNSGRWAGCANQCPGKDARRCPPNPTLPRLCPDLSATVYGGRVALAGMARALGRTAEGDAWEERAEGLRRLILEKLWVPEDAAFYDLDAQNRFVKVRSDVLSRVCGEHVVDQKKFDAMWSRQLGNPKAFWTPYPLPSVAMDDATFVRPIPRNSWGGPSQALTALRAGRWLEHYGRAADFARMMEAWCGAMVRDPSFRQQLDPVTGEFTQTGSASYSPAALVMYDYTWGLAGVRREGEELHWNVRPECGAAEGGVFALPLGAGKVAQLRYRGRTGELRVGGKMVARVEGCARLVTSLDGVPRFVLGINSVVSRVKVSVTGKPTRQVVLEGNARKSLS